jgi:hypothetical protein
MHDYLKSAVYLGSFFFASIVMMGIFAAVYGELTSRCGDSFGIIQGICGVFQGTIGAIQGTFGVIQMTMIISLRRHDGNLAVVYGEFICRCWDLGNVQRDSGNIWRDLGNIRRDSGNVRRDSGNIRRDSGNIRCDSGNIRRDSGNIQLLGAHQQMRSRQMRSTGARPIGQRE